MYRVQVLTDKGDWVGDVTFDNVDDAVNHAHSLLRQWMIVEWRVIDGTGAEVKSWKLFGNHD